MDMSPGHRHTKGSLQPKRVLLKFRRICAKDPQEKVSLAPRYKWLISPPCPPPRLPTKPPQEHTQFVQQSFSQSYWLKSSKKQLTETSAKGAPGPRSKWLISPHRTGHPSNPPLAPLTSWETTTHAFASASPAFLLPLVIMIIIPMAYRPACFTCIHLCKRRFLWTYRTKIVGVYRE